MNIHPYNMKSPGRFWRSGTTRPLPERPGSLDLFRIPGPEDEAEASFAHLAPSPEEPSLHRAAVEAVLFVSREPLSSRRLAQLAELPEGAKIRNLLRELNELYDRRPSAFRIVEVAGGFQLRTRPEFAPWLVRLQEVPVTVRLSGPTMETLAVIAYRQPVLRAEIERIRGVQSGELIRQLMDRDLVRIVGRSEELGRPFFYGTTKTFLEIFGLGSLRDLPDRELFAPVGGDDNYSNE